MLYYISFQATLIKTLVEVTSQYFANKEIHTDYWSFGVSTFLTSLRLWDVGVSYNLWIGCLRAFQPMKV